ncbi:MAG: RNA-binding cell elongation regulator Jag/EloR [Thermodesulfobacteriota bacterium]
MESMEFEGKTTEEAIQNASEYLDIPVEELDIDVIEPGSAGIFGLVGTKKAKVKVSYTLQEEAGEENETLRDISSMAEAAEVQEEMEDAEEGGDKEEKQEPWSTDRPAQTLLEQQTELALAKETLETILDLIPMDTKVAAQRVDGNINLNIEGDNSGLLIGRRGRTLDALQFIVNKIVNKTLERKVRVVVDSERYRRRRRDSLRQLALRMGDKAKRIGKPVTTNPMNPADRRIVHLALKDDNRLDTRSRGEGLMKKVVIIPRK